MNRANFGNVSANALQTMAISGGTAAAVWARDKAKLDTTLNNLTEEQRAEIAQAKAQKAYDKAHQYNIKASDKSQHMTEEQQIAYRKKQAEDAVKYTNKKEGGSQEEDVSVDDIMSDIDVAPLTEQGDNINTKIKNDINFVKAFKKRKRPKIKTQNTVEEIKK